MIWKCQQVLNLKSGDSRKLNPFAWLPKQIGDDIVWLQRYEVLQAWIITETVIPLNGQDIKFVFGAWETISEQVKSKVDE